VTKAAPPALTLSEDDYRSLVEQSPLGVTVVVDDRFAYANPAAAALLGAGSPAEVIGQLISTFLLPTDVPAAQRRVEEILGGRRRSAEYRTVRRLDGSTAVVLASAVGTAWKGRPAVHAEMRDATAAAAMETALRRSEEVFRTAFSEGPVGLTRIGAGGRILAANDAYCRMLGLPPERVVGHDVEEFTHPDDLADTRAVLAAIDASAAADTRQLEKRYVGGSGQVVWARVTTVRVAAADGTLHNLSQVADITDQRRAQEELKQANASLERRVAERTMELEASRRDLEAVVRELEGSDSAIARDLRAQVRAVRAAADRVRDVSGPGLSASQAADLERVCDAARRMTALIEGVLTLSGASRAPLQIGEVDLATLTATALARLRLLDPDRDVEDSVAEDMVVRGDERLLALVVDNLVDNAWKFTAPVEAPRIEVGFERGPTQATLYVADNGVGFDMRYRERLFGAFERLHSTAAFPGSGIGLATVRRVVARHGGTVSARSEPGQGATFTVVLPQP